MKWLISALLILLIALIFDLSLLAYAMYALLGVMLVSRLLARKWATVLSTQRQCNQLTAEIGDVVTVLVKISNDSRLPVPWVLLEDLLPHKAIMHDPPDLKVMGDRLHLLMLKSGAKKTFLYRMQCNCRGYFQIGPLVLETGDLFGLHRRYRLMNEPNFLMVYPRVIPLEGFDIASKRPIGEVKMSYRLYEDPTRIAGVRRFEAGDPLNRVHWRATARTGLLHSKIYEPSTIAGATILLDFHRHAHDARQEPFRSELAITATASIANALYELGQQVGLVTNGRDAVDRIRQEGWEPDPRTRSSAHETAAMREASDRLQPLVVETRRGHEQFARILETLARLELTDGLDLADLITETNSRMPRDATVIAILPQVTVRSAVALGNLQRLGYSVSAILNIYEEIHFADAAGPLLAEGVGVRHLKNEQAIATICRNFVLR